MNRRRRRIALPLAVLLLPVALAGCDATTDPGAVDTRATHSDGVLSPVEAHSLLGEPLRRPRLGEPPRRPTLWSMV